MHVLVIGGSRFIGRAVVQRLLVEGHRVTVLNRGKSPDPFGTRVSRVVGDRSDPETLKRAVSRRDFDAVVDMVAFREEDTKAAIEAFSGRIGHFLHISTAAVYLIRDGIYCPFREEDFAGRLQPKTEATASTWLYAYHKRRCEVALQHAWENQQFPFTSLRLPVVVGPGDYTARTQAYFERLLDGGPIILPDGGLNSWGFLWVHDVAEVVVSNLANANAFGNAYNLAQREVVNLRQFVELSAAFLDRRPALVSVPTEWLKAVQLGTSFSPYSHDHDIVLDISAAQRDLLFKPTPFTTWCEQLTQHFRSSWDGSPSKLYSTRPLELKLVEEFARLRLPSLNPSVSVVSA
ncbi:MAG: epimerase [Thermoanaerobaculum sp.]|uniref:NAD-dependent epimerase/dehydratase family protein n=2 Tax=Thermoanaerobaculum aquaticum TaxID=1312852 RepID=A0A7V1ZGZ8_9BACT|nr:MAG: epimerase [Thermoanaerobaculum sp.]